MSELANYSIETDQLIWLVFKDGRSLRVPVESLPKYLGSRDLQKIHRAMNLRQDFLRHNMPKTLVAILAFGLLALMAAGSQVIARLDRGASPARPGLPNTQIVRAVSPASTAPSPAPASSTDGATSLARRPAVSTKAKSPVVARAVTSRPVATPFPQATPAASMNEALNASVDQPLATPSPSPVPSPTPSPVPVPTPPAGQVLGDSTSPDDPKPTPAP